MTFSMFNIRSASFDHYYATICTCEVEDTVLSVEVFGKAHLKRDNGARFSHWTNKVIVIHSELDNKATHGSWCWWCYLEISGNQKGLQALGCRATTVNRSPLSPGHRYTGENECIYLYESPVGSAV